MAKKTRAVLKTYFETGDFPTEEQFADLIDSFLLVDEAVPMSQVTNLTNTLNTFIADQAIVQQVDGMTADVTIANACIVTMIVLRADDNETVTLTAGSTNAEIDLVAGVNKRIRIDEIIEAGEHITISGAAGVLKYAIYKQAFTLV